MVISADILLFKGDEDDLVKLLAIMGIEDRGDGLASNLGSITAWITIDASAYGTECDGLQVMLDGKL